MKASPRLVGEVRLRVEPSQQLSLELGYMVMQSGGRQVWSVGIYVYDHVLEPQQLLALAVVCVVEAVGGHIHIHTLGELTVKGIVAQSPVYMVPAYPQNRSFSPVVSR